MVSANLGSAKPAILPVTGRLVWTARIVLPAAAAACRQFVSILSALIQQFDSFSVYTRQH
jgi:hypothetical protein